MGHLTTIQKITLEIVLGFLLLFLIIWFGIRPFRESAVISDRQQQLQRLQNYTAENLDYVIGSWLHVSRFVTTQVTEHPAEGERILKSVMLLHPEIVQIQIQSAAIGDELSSHNIDFPEPNLQIADSLWIRSRADSTIRVAWISTTSRPAQLFVTQTTFHIASAPFFLTVAWDAKPLLDNLSAMPIENNSSICIATATRTLIHTKTAQSFLAPVSPDRLRPSEIISSGSTDWLVTTTPLHTIQLWLSTEIPCPKIVDALRQTILFDLLFLFLTIILLLSVQRFIIEPGRSPNNASQEKDAPSHPPTDEESSDSSTTDHNT